MNALETVVGSDDCEKPTRGRKSTQTTNERTAQYK
jgi:hypothetical protein